MSKVDSIVRADANGKFLKRFLFIGIVCFGITGWCLYDGMVKYPKELKRAEAYKALEVEGPTKQSEMWYQMAAKKEWNNEIPKPPGEVEQSIRVQYGMAAIFLLAALGLLWWYFRSMKGWLEMDKNGISSNTGARIEFSDIARLDKRKWDKKGIAKLLGGEGPQAAAFVLDDFKFDRPQVDKMIRKVESLLDRDQIVNGKTEEEKDAEKAAKEAEKAAADAE